MADLTDHTTMDARDRERLWGLLKPYAEMSRLHIEGAKLSSLASAVCLPSSIEACVAMAEKHKSHIDALVEIKRQSMAVRAIFIPEFPRVDIISASND